MKKKKISYKQKISLIALIPSLACSPVAYSITLQDIPESARPDRIQSEPILPPKKPLQFTIEEETKEDREKKEKEKEKEKTKQPATPTKKPDGTTQPTTEESTKQQQEEKKEIRFELKDVIIEGNKKIPKSELKKVYSAKIKQPISLLELRNIAQDIETYYRAKGYFLARIIIPPQRIKKTDAVVKLIILEGKISKINLIGDAGKNYKILMSYMQPVEDADVINNKIIEKSLLLANDIPGIAVQAVLSPSQTVVGAAELNLKIIKNKPNGFVSLDNRGTKFVGNKQLRVGGSFYSLVSADALYSDFQTTLPDNNQLQSFTAMYKVLVGSKGTNVNVTAKKTHTNPLILQGGTLTENLVKGRSDRAEVSVSHPLVRSRLKNILLTIGGYFTDAKNQINSDNSYLYNDKLRVIYAGANYSKISTKSSLSLNLKLSKGLDIAKATKRGSNNNQSRGVDSTANFAKANFDATYTRNLATNLSVLFGLSSQFTNHALLSSEEFGFGGEAFGSAFNSSEIVGDKGISGKIEIRYNTFPKIPDVNYVQFFTAYHRGKTWNNGGQTVQSLHSSAASLSVGARFSILKGMTGSVEVAKPYIRDSSSNDTRDIRYFAKITGTF